jgi:hypothetical protein
VIPWPLSGSGTGPYLALYVITLALHAALIGYVLAGTGYAAVAAIRRRPDPIAEAARDWLPFYLGAAITAGVAPLVFIQLLHQERFYTADLLMGPRWGAIVPALVVGFYALYLHKATERPRRRVLAITAALACFGFVAWSWTEHHLLMADDARWHDFYAAGRRFHASDALIPRLALWLASALPLFAAIAAWQVTERSEVSGSRDAAGPARGNADARWRRRLGVIALIGIAASTLLAVVVRSRLDPAARAGVEAASPWLVVLIAGRIAEAAAWVAVIARRGGTTPIALATGGAVASLVAGVVLREAARIHQLAPARPAVTEAGGALVFAIAVIAVSAAMVWIARVVRRGRITPPAPAPSAPPRPPPPA